MNRAKRPSVSFRPELRLKPEAPEEGEERSGARAPTGQWLQLDPGVSIRSAGGQTSSPAATGTDCASRGRSKADGPSPSAFSPGPRLLPFPAAAGPPGAEVDLPRQAPDFFPLSPYPKRSSEAGGWRPRVGSLPKAGRVRTRAIAAGTSPPGSLSAHRGREMRPVGANSEVNSGRSRWCRRTEQGRRMSASTDRVGRSALSGDPKCLNKTQSISF